MRVLIPGQARRVMPVPEVLPLQESEQRVLVSAQERLRALPVSRVLEALSLQESEKRVLLVPVQARQALPVPGRRPPQESEQQVLIPARVRQVLRLRRVVKVALRVLQLPGRRFAPAGVKVAPPVVQREAQRPARERCFAQFLQLQPGPFVRRTYSLAGVRRRHDRLPLQWFRLRRWLRGHGDQKADRGRSFW